MMTLKRLRILADSYGAELQRWPERLRPQARALLAASMEARAVIAHAQELDEAITSACAERGARLWRGDDGDAALQRLRANVTARTRVRPASATPPRRARWISLAAAASVAVIAGFVLGILYSPAAPSQDLTALLQPAPLQSLTD